MEDLNGRSRIMLISGAVIIAALLGLSVFSLLSGSKTKKALDKEKLNSEQLLSSNLNLNKEIEKNRNEMEALRSKNLELNGTVEELNKQLSDNNNRIAYLVRTNNSLNGFKTQYEALLKEKAGYEEAIAGLTKTKQELSSQIGEKDRELTSLKQKLENIESLYDKVKNTPENVMVSASRGNKKDKLMILASRTRKLTIDFAVPASLTDAIGFRLITPEGKTIDQSNKALSWSFPDEKKNLTASLSTIPGRFEESKQVQLTYSSATRLTPGIYKIEIISKNQMIGTCRVKLR